MTTERIIVIGASAGGVDAVRTILAGLPATFLTPICVVVHTAPESPGVLHEIFDRAGPLPAAAARQNQRIQSGHVYVAPPDHHLLVEPGQLRLTKGPKENRFRPAIDPLFRSAAQVFGPAATGVVLTGNLDDGTAGLLTIKQMGGVAIVQDPASAQYPGMPLSATRHVDCDYVVPLNEIASILIALEAGPIEERRMEPQDHINVELNIAKEQNAIEAGVEGIGTPSSFACPECHGVLLELQDGALSRFRCHTGHAYSLEALIGAMNEGIEISLWESVRALEEGFMVLRRMAEHLSTHDDEARGDAARRRADTMRKESDSIRAFLSHHTQADAAAESVPIHDASPL